MSAYSEAELNEMDIRDLREAVRQGKKRYPELKVGLSKAQLIRSIIDLDLPVSDSRKRLTRIMSRISPSGRMSRSSADKLFRAIGDGNLRKVEEIIRDRKVVDYTDDKGQTPLIYAVNFPNVNVVKALINVGSEIDAIDLSNNTPLTTASKMNNLEAALALLQAREARVSETKDQMKHMVHAKDDTGYTAFDWAIFNHNHLMAYLLISAGANMYTETFKPLSVLDFTIVNKDWETFNVLLNAGYDPLKVNNVIGFTSLMQAIGLRDKEYLGLDMAARIYEVLLQKRDDGMMDEKEIRDYITGARADGDTITMIAVETCDPVIVKYVLFNLAAYPDVIDKSGQTVDKKLAIECPYQWDEISNLLDLSRQEWKNIRDEKKKASRDRAERNRVRAKRGLGPR